MGVAAPTAIPGNPSIDKTKIPTPTRSVNKRSSGCSEGTATSSLFAVTATLQEIADEVGESRLNVHRMFQRLLNQDQKLELGLPT